MNFLSRSRPCPFGDPYCPCQDGDPCHYAGKNPWPAPLLYRIEEAIAAAEQVAREARDHGNGAWPLCAEQVLRAAAADRVELRQITDLLGERAVNSRVGGRMLAKLAARYGVDP